MTGETLAARLEAAGFEPDDAASRARLVAEADAGFTGATRRPPQWRWFVPGRVEIFGKHTDYAGGQSLLGALPRGFAVVAAPRDDGMVRVHDARYGGMATIAAGADTSSLRGWRSYIGVVVSRFARNFPGASFGIDIAIASDLPRAAGVSSSSALVVGIAKALARRAALEARPEWQAAIADPRDLAWYLGCVENGLDYRTLPGTAGVGTHGGSEDHTAILNCLPHHVSQYGFVPVRHFGDIAVPAGWRFVFASSGVHADKAGSVRDRYNRASLATRALVDLWAGEGARPASLAAALEAAADAQAELEARIDRSSHPDFDASALRRRLAHFVAENGRVEAAAEAFRAADAARLGELSAASQLEAETLLGNQIHETVSLARLARECGAAAASSFGAGFGGSVWALLPDGDADRFSQEWVRAYAAEHQPRDPVQVFTARPGPSVVEL